MTDTLTSAWNVRGFLQELFEIGTGPSWQHTQGVCLAPAWRSGPQGECRGTGQGRGRPWHPQLTDMSGSALGN
jgi:hypothetical protein